MILQNRINKEILKENLKNEPFIRRTISFYKYIRIDNPQEFRDMLYLEWNFLCCFGRIYIAREGINAQMSLPEHHLSEFIQKLYQHNELNGIPIKYAIEDDGKSFYKLTVKVREKIVADGLDDNSYDVTNVGTHLSAIEFHKAIQDPDNLVIDMRNRYESEIGKFENAYLPDSDTFKEAIQLVEKRFDTDKHKKILLYCTGGIRCEKASAYLKFKGFRNVNQLYGGIIEYAHQIKKEGLTSKFIGKNFVFDERLGESIDDQIISTCHQCGKPANTHRNCANNDCHVLFIQCEECKIKYQECCSTSCQQILNLPESERKAIRIKFQDRYALSKLSKRPIKSFYKI